MAQAGISANRLELLQIADAVARELGDITRDFDAWAARDLVAINTALRGKKLEPIAVITRQEWEAAGQ